MMFISIICLLFLQLVPILALPTGQLKVSLILEKDYHSLNSETVLIQSDDSLIVSSTNTNDKSAKKTSNNDQYDWFMAHFTSKGSFEIESLEKELTISKDGSLKLSQIHNHQQDESESQHDEEFQKRAVFSIKDGKLMFNSADDFTLCPIDSQKDQFSIHLTYSESANSDECSEGIPGVKLKVFNQLGIQARDFEAPEFLYSTGKIVYF